MSDRPDAQDAAFVLDVLAGRCRAQVVSAAATLGLPDLLEAGPRGLDELAAATRCDVAGLERLLVAFAAMGFCERTADRTFALTRRGQALRRNELGALAAFLGSPAMWDPWSRLPEALRAGGTNAFERTHGRDLYDFLARTPAAAAAYDAAIDAYTRDEAGALGDRFDFSKVRTVLDVGGGLGTSLLVLLRRWPHLRGMLVDLPHVAERTRARLDAELPGRVDVQAGDFMEGLPRGADACLLKHVLHNWDDGKATAVLRRCAEVLEPGGRMLVIEFILPADDRHDAARLLDLEMLVLTGGRERRKPELRRLFRGAGLQLDGVERLTPSSWLLLGSHRPA